MKPALTLAPTTASTLSLAPSFSICCPQEGPVYHQLVLEDEQGCLAQWVLPMPLKRLSKQPSLLWLLPAPPAPDLLACVETGTVRPAATAGLATDLRTDLAQGMLRLHFGGQLLRGYHRLHCLPEGNGLLWQLIPLGG